MLFTEGGRTAYPAVTAAALAAPGLEMSTGVAVAFPRSPMITAQVAWELQELTGGRFRLGLGTQVRTHVVRRYGVEFERPGPRLRDYVLAVKACFAAFRGEPLDHHGEFYDLDFLNRQWSPGPIEQPDPKVDIAAVNPWMLRMAGEVADGVHVHPIGEPGYLARHVVPGIAAGADRGRSRPERRRRHRAGHDDRRRHRRRDRSRLATWHAASLSFYGSTPNYAFIWDEAGFEGTTERIRAKQKAGDLAGMAAEITDDHLAVFCTEARWDDLADALDRQVRRHRRPAGVLQPGLRHPRPLRALRRRRARDLRPHRRAETAAREVCGPAARCGTVLARLRSPRRTSTPRVRAKSTHHPLRCRTCDGCGPSHRARHRHVDRRRAGRHRRPRGRRRNAGRGDRWTCERTRPRWCGSTRTRRRSAPTDLRVRAVSGAS